MRAGRRRHLLPLHDLQPRRAPGRQPLQLPGGRLLSRGAGRQLPRAERHAVHLRLLWTSTAARISTKKMPAVAGQILRRASQSRRCTQAIDAAYDEYDRHMRAGARQGQRDHRRCPQRKASRIIVLAGRPYHVDPEINHGIDKLIIRLRRRRRHRGLRQLARSRSSTPQC